MLFCLDFTHLNIIRAKTVYHGAGTIARIIPSPGNFYSNRQKIPFFLCVMTILSYFYRYILLILYCIKIHGSHRLPGKIQYSGKQVFSPTLTQLFFSCIFWLSIRYQVPGKNCVPLFSFTSHFVE